MIGLEVSDTGHFALKDNSISIQLDSEVKYKAHIMFECFWRVTVYFQDKSEG